MCGIIGFIGNQPATPILLDGLKKLEYRGYDSAGIAVIENGEIQIKKVKGKMENLCKLVNNGKDMKSTVGIGHTRWATHGKPSDENSHPHFSNSGRFAVVHNGIIENYATLKADLISRGCKFNSETDTEVVAQLLDINYNGSFFQTMMATASQLEGSYALAVLCSDNPDEIIVMRKSSPLVIGLGDDGNYIASDVTAFLAYTKKTYSLDDGELAVIKKDGVKIYDKFGNPIEKAVNTITWDISAAQKGGYEHFMIKEIMEQPQALNATISPRISDNGRIVLDSIKLTDDYIKGIKRIYIVACGSAYHVGVVGRYVIENLTRIPVDTEVASEFRYHEPIVDSSTLTIVISQSGETADTLAALREAKSRGSRVVSIVNVVGSSIANESDDVLYTWAGPEISVATTKAYSTQLTLIYLVGLYLAEKLGTIGENDLKRVLNSLISLPDKVTKILELVPEIEKISQRYAYLEHAYFIGRNLDYAVALEASLKLKEISYIHSEAYAAGELKHGTISLIEDGTLVVALCCCGRLFDKTMSNIKEVKARGAEVLGLTVEGNTALANEADNVLYIPSTDEILIPSLEVVPLQLLGYYIAKARKCDIDKPRNLAKSVTVE